MATAPGYQEPIDFALAEASAATYKDVRPKTKNESTREQHIEDDFGRATRSDDDGDDVRQAVPGQDAKMLCSRQEVFPKPHIDLCPEHLIYDKTIQTENEFTSCWRSNEDDKIFLGGESIITTLRADGSQKTFNLWYGDTDVNRERTVYSGLALTSVKQLIYVKGWRNEYRTYEIYTVNINEDQDGDTSLHPLNTLNFRGWPLCIFNIDKLRYGVLCEEGIIEFFSLKNILLDQNPKSSNVIKLETKIYGYDTASATPEEIIVIASLRFGHISMFNTDGKLLHIYRVVNEMHAVGDAWFSLFSHTCTTWGSGKLFSQCFENGIMLATADKGVICSIKNGILAKVEVKGTRDMPRLDNIRDYTTTQGRMWIMKDYELHVYNTAFASQTGVTSDFENTLGTEHCDGTEEVFMRHLIDPCPGEFKHQKTMTTQRKHNCCWRSDNDDKIFLGGKNVITVLREDGIEQTYAIIDTTPGRSNLGVTNGLSVTSFRHIIIVDNTHPGREEKRYLHVVDIPDDLPSCSHVLLLGTFTIDNPVSVFMAEKLQYGVLCQMKSTSDIEIFEWAEIISRDGKGDLGCSTYITLDRACSNKDSACASSDRNICVSFVKMGCVCLYDTKGNVLHVFDRIKTGDDQKPRDLVESRSFRKIGLCLQKCKNGILIINEEGVVLTLVDCKWQISNDKKTTRLGRILDCVYSGRRMWVIDRKDQRNVRIYRY